MVTPAVYSLDPVPGSAAPIVLDAGNGHRVGYVLFRTFIGPAAEALRTTIGNLRQAGATDLVIDLRYNGGGLTSVAEVLANLLRRTHSPADVMARTVHNPQQAASDTAILFGAEPNAMDPGKIAFIVGGGTASASEMVVNVLQPYLGSNLALVGSRTYGKPVGMEAFDNSSCDWLLYLVSFSMVNANGQGGYFQGLPDAGFRGISIAALDDQAYALGDPAEPSLAAALAWIGQGQTGSPIPPAAAGALKPADGAARILHPSPTLAQQFQPGLF